MSSSEIVWPERLLTIVREHLESVENPDAPAIPPLLQTGLVTIGQFFDDNEAELERRLVAAGLTLDTIEFCAGFAIEVLEHACQLSFLTPRERRTVGAAVRQLEKRTGLVSKPRGGRAASKRNRGENGNGDPADGGAKYCRVLGLEYLLRFFISMPLILDHYDKLGGSAIPAFSKQPLWLFASETLRLLNTMPSSFSPISKYVLLK